MADYACPILPSMDFDRTAAFYDGFGFEQEVRLSDEAQSAPYMILSHDRLFLHFFHPAGPAPSPVAVYIVTEDADRWADRLRPLGLPAAGAPRFEEAADMPWDRRECAVVDPDGNRIRFGAPMPEDT